MPKVKAVHELVYPDKVIAPGTIFASTGKELEDLLALGAVAKIGADEAEDAGGEKTEAPAKKPGAKATKEDGLV